MQHASIFGCMIPFYSISLDYTNFTLFSNGFWKETSHRSSPNNNYPNGSSSKGLTKGLSVGSPKWIYQSNCIYLLRAVVTNSMSLGWTCVWYLILIMISYWALTHIGIWDTSVCDIYKSLVLYLVQELVI